MGVVYEAEQSSPRRKVALKVLLQYANSESAAWRMLLEVEVLARLHHPGIAQVYDFGQCDGGAGLQPYFAMELIDGVDLRTYADRTKIDTLGRLELFASIADAIEHAHQKGVIHRDLKPDNVIDAEGRPKVLDFGIAQITDEATVVHTALTEEGQLIGTLNYMAPEQVWEGPLIGSGIPSLVGRSGKFPRNLKIVNRSETTLRSCMRARKARPKHT